MIRSLDFIATGKSEHLAQYACALSLALPTCNIMEPSSKKMRLMSPNDEDVPVPSSGVGLECIPNEILYLIYQWLPLRDKLYLRHVSRRFYSSLNDSTLWKCAAIGPVECKNVKFVKGVLKFLKPFVTTLAVNGFPHAPSILAPFLTSCQQVKCLSLVGTRFPYDTFKRIINNIPHLSRLLVSLTSFSPTPQHGSGLEPINELPGSIKQLVMIATRGYFRWTAFTFNVPNLAIIDYISLPPPNTTCDFPNYDAVLSIYPPAQLDSHIRLTPSITVTNCATKLSVEGTSDTVTLVKAVSTSISTDSYIYYHITSFDSHVVPRVTAPSTPLTKAIGSTVTSLDCGFDNAVMFTNIVQYTPNLVVLNLNTVPNPDGNRCMPLDEVFGILSVYCKGLQYVHCTMCDSVDFKDPAFEVGDVYKLWESIISLKQLKHLSICGCFFIPSQLQAVEVADSTGRVLEIAKCFKPDLQLLPHTLCSLSVVVHSYKSKAPAYPLQDILTIVSQIVSLRCLCVDAHYESFRSSVISMHALRNCENLEEFSLIANYESVQYDPVVIQRLKHLTLSFVSLPDTFFDDIVPLSGSNCCLETLDLYITNDAVPNVHSLVSMVKRCQKLVSCEVCFKENAYLSSIKKVKSEIKPNCLLWFNLIENRDVYFAKRSRDLLEYRV